MNSRAHYLPLTSSASKDGPDLLSMEVCLRGNNVFHAMRQLLLFESKIPKNFTSINAQYRATCGQNRCESACQVPHLTLDIKVTGADDDRIGLTLESHGTMRRIENILPQVPNGHYSCRTWRNSRWHVVLRMLLCLNVHYLYGNTQHIQRLIERPLHVYMMGGLMSRVLDIQQWLLLPAIGGCAEEISEEEKLLLEKEFV